MPGLVEAGRHTQPTSALDQLGLEPVVVTAGQAAAVGQVDVVGVVARVMVKKIASAAAPASNIPQKSRFVCCNLNICP